jgi:hypothetical protein
MTPRKDRWRLPGRHCEERSDEAIQLRAKRAKQKARQSRQAQRFICAPAGAWLDCFATGERSDAVLRTAMARNDGSS